MPERSGNRDFSFKFDFFLDFFRKIGYLIEAYELGVSGKTVFPV